MIENVPSFTSLRVSDALKDLVLEIARTFSLALLWRQVMLAGTGNELIADEDRSPGRIGELHCVDAEILRLCVRDWVRAALQKRLGVGMRRQELFDRIGMRRVGLGRTSQPKAAKVRPKAIPASRSFCVELLPSRPHEPAQIPEMSDPGLAAPGPRLP